MREVRKSILRKLFINLVLFALMISAIAFFFYRQDLNAVSYQFLLISLGVFLIYFLLIYWWDIVRPLKKILYEMQALISNKRYKRIYTDRIDEIGVIAHFFNEVTKGFGRVSGDIKEKERMLEELNVASQLQRDILPFETPPTAGLDISAKNKPATELGGDSFNVFNKNDKTYIYVGDVTGHGVAAGLIMTMVSSLVSVFADMHDSVYDIIVNVNRYIKKHVKKAMFMTMVMMSWDQKSKKLTYVGAGHEHILVYRSKSGQCDAFLSGGVALGMVPDNTKLIKENEIVLDNSDVVVLFSDGITEARSESDELFGLERLKEAVKEYAAQYSADGINYHIARDVITFMGSHPQEDDMTLIVMKRDDNDAEKGPKDTGWKE